MAIRAELFERTGRQTSLVATAFTLLTGVIYATYSVGPPGEAASS